MFLNMLDSLVLFSGPLVAWLFRFLKPATGWFGGKWQLGLDVLGLMPGCVLAQSFLNSYGRFRL